MGRFVEIAREVLGEIRSKDKGKENNCIEETAKDPYTLLQEMNDRIDEIYRAGDYSRLKQDKTFWKALKEKEEAMDRAIIEGAGYIEAVKNYEDYLKQGIWRLRLEEMAREEFERAGKIFEVKTEGGRKVYIASTKEIIERKQKEGDAWFIPVEVEKLKGQSPEMVDKVIDIKEIFPGSKVIQ